MSNDKLQASDIAGFAANGLKVRSNDTIYNIDGILKTKYVFEGGATSDIGNSVDTPILYNPDILTQTITFRGKQVCHLIELAKIAFPGKEFIIYKNAVVCPKEEIRFNWYENHFAADNVFSHEVYDVPNQPALFAYLNWALVDYMGLGERGLCEYVDLENNNVYAK